MQDILSNIKLFYTLGFYDYYLLPGLLLAAGIGAYCYVRLGRAFAHFHKNPKSTKSRIFRVALALLVASFCINVWSPAFQLIAFPLFCLSLLLDVGAKVAGAIRAAITHTKRPQARITRGFSAAYWSGGLLAVTFVAFLIVANYNLTHVVNTSYTYTSEKITRPLNVLFISDTHYGTIEDPAELDRIVDEINQNGIDYDVAVLGGDIVDERTSNENMNRAFDTLSRLHTKDGIFFVYGNHDRQPGATDLPLSGRSFTDEELIQACERNNIEILSDTGVDLGDYVLAGREDYGWEGEAGTRKTPEDVLSSLDTSKLTIMVDHQAVEIEQDGKAGADLLLSGHSHGGQTFPFGLLQRYVLDRPVWGKYSYDDIVLFISSGLIGWGSPIRDEGVSEYMTVHIEPAEKPSE